MAVRLFRPYGPSTSNAIPRRLAPCTNRGNNRELLFKDDVDRQPFLGILADSVDTYQVRIHSFVLMNNNWHLLVQTPLANLSEFMRRFNITYTSHYNRRHKRVGHLYQSGYRSFLVEEDGYLNVVSRYIHLNPVRISSMKEVELEKRLEYLYGYKWSSLRGYVEADHELDWVEKCLTERLAKDSQQASLMQRVAVRMSKIKI